MAKRSIYNAISYDNTDKNVLFWMLDDDFRIKNQSTQKYVKVCDGKVIQKSKTVCQLNNQIAIVIKGSDGNLYHRYNDYSMNLISKA